MATTSTTIIIDAAPDKVYNLLLALTQNGKKLKQMLGADNMKILQKINAGFAASADAKTVQGTLLNNSITLDPEVMVEETGTTSGLVKTN